MASIGEGAARGLEAGFRMGQGFIDQRDREEQRRLQNEMAAADRQERSADRDFQRERALNQEARLGRQDYRQTLLDERTQNMDAEQALDAEFKDLQAEGKGLYEQYGDQSKIPKDLADSYTLRVKDTRGRLTEARAKRYAPLVEKQRQEASQLWSRIQTGEIPIEQVPDDQLVTSLTALTRRDIRDLMPMAGGENGGKSMVQQAGMDFMTGAQSGNDEMMLGAANVLFKPELMIGVGGPGRDGSEILSKKIVQLIPHPNDPTHFTPLLEVKVRREDGKVGTYRAPVTENRSSDPNDNIKTISMQDGLDRVGQLTALSEALNQRGIIEKIAKGMNDAGDGPQNFLEAFYATGGQKPKAEKVDIGHFEDFGGYKMHYLPDGREVRINKTATPTSGGGEDPHAKKLRGIEAALKSGDISPDEAKEARRGLVLAGGKGSMDTPKAQFDAENKLRDEHQAQSKTFVKVRDAFGKTQAAAQDPTSMGDIALIFGYMKMLDPDSVVREGEFATAQNAGSIPDRIRNAYNKAMEGTRLNEGQRKDMISQARKVYNEQKKGQDKLDGKYRELSKSYGLNASNVVTAYDTDGEGVPGQPAAAGGVGAQKPAAPRQITDGAIIVNRQTGQRMQMRGGQWQPI
jgi:hypothetical protein